MMDCIYAADGDGYRNNLPPVKETFPLNAVVRFQALLMAMLEMEVEILAVSGSSIVTMDTKWLERLFWYVWPLANGKDQTLNAYQVCWRSTLFFYLILTICLVSTSCGPTPQIENGYIQPGGSNYGAIRQIICWQPYEFRSDIKQIRCKSNGRWSEAPKCSLPRTTPATTKNTDGCGELPTVPNGIIWTTSHSVGFPAAILCDAGFERKGPLTIICQPSGQWSTLSTVCQPKHCSSKVSTSLVPDSQSTIKIKPSIICNAGYQSSLSASIQCNSAEEWSPIQYSCGKVTGPSIPGIFHYY